MSAPFFLLNRIAGENKRPGRRWKQELDYYRDTYVQKHQTSLQF